MGKRRSNSRRQEVIRQKTARAPTLRDRFRQHASPLSLLVALALTVAVSLTVLYGGESMRYRTGEQLNQEVRARVAFDVPNPQRTERMRDDARRNTPNVFRINDSLVSRIESQLGALLAAAKEAGDSYESFVPRAESAGWNLSPEAFAALSPFTTEAGSQQYTRRVKNLISQHLTREAIVEAVDPTARQHMPSRAVLIDSEGHEREIDASFLQTPDPAIVKRVAKDMVIQFPLPLQPAIADAIVKLMLPPDHAPEPIYRFDYNDTRRRIEANVAAVKPQFDHFQKGDVLAGGPSPLTEADMLLLRREHDQYLKRLRDDPQLWRQHQLGRAGRVGIVVLLITGLVVYTLRYQSRIARNPSRALALAALVLLTVIPARIISLRVMEPEIVVGIVVIIASMVTIAYNERYALFVTTVLSLLSAVALESKIDSVLTMMTASWTTVLLVRDIRTRSKLVQVGCAGSLAAFLASMAGSFMEGQHFGFALEHGAWAAGSVFVASLVIQAVLPAIERVFKIATSMTLLEWTYASRPLLKRLAQEAPGTYNHSLVVSTMAEAAADAIGANGLLAKVGALYHDAGKIHKPDYFAENQEARMNRHDGLTPTMSLLIIRGHVKDGIELARGYGLPRVLIPFIAEHHGTTLVRFFHHRASELQPLKASGRHDREVPESEFRYTGPKPQSKETAILMICDGVEGVVRALPEPTPMRIENAVHHIIMDRLNDGQFDECDITLRELHRVEESLVKTLSRFYHGRVSYPKAARPESASVRSA